MSSIIADNPIAKQYSEIEKSIDFCTATDDEQLLCMMKMRALLLSCKGSTPILDWGVYNMQTGQRVYTTATDRLESINRRIRRFESQIERALAS